MDSFATTKQTANRTCHDEHFMREWPALVQNARIGAGAPLVVQQVHREQPAFQTNTPTHTRMDQVQGEGNRTCAPPLPQ
jgi:hypothetical protein